MGNELDQNELDQNELDQNEGVHNQKEPRFRIVEESLVSGNFLVTDAQNPDLEPQELRALIKANVITEVEMTEIQAQLDMILKIIEVEESLQLMESLPKNVDTSRKAQWQHMPQKGNFMLFDGKWATIIELVPSDSIPPMIGGGWTAGFSMTLLIIEQGEETPKEVEVCTYSTFGIGPEFKTLLTGNMASECQFVAPSRLKNVGITVPEK